jgi:ribose 5-phosphate isomerase A
MDLRYEARRNVSIYAADLIEHCIGCTIAIGSGSTVKILIDELTKKGIINKFRYISTSIDTTLYLRKAGARDIESGICPGDIDIYVDSADEIDPKLNLLKGGGGALFREKIAMLSSNRRIIIADETKLVERLGSTRAVPLEVEIYAISYVLKEIERLGYRVKYRETEGKLGPLISDNGNVLIDVYTGPIEDPVSIDKLLKNIEGVITTGIFPYMDYEVVIGRLSGAIDILKR